MKDEYLGLPQPIYVESIIKNCGSDKIIVNIQPEKKQSSNIVGPIACGIKQSFMSLDEKLVQIGHRPEFKLGKQPLVKEISNVIFILGHF